MHEEMPQVRPEGIVGFQLWVNLLANHEMMSRGTKNILLPRSWRSKRRRHRIGDHGEVDGTLGPRAGLRQI